MRSTYWQPLNLVNGGLEREIVRGESEYLYDKNGKKYIDAYSGLWNVVLGYSDEDIIEAIINQLKKLPYINPITLKTDIVIEVSNMLCNLTHENISNIVYTCSGSEAIEAAIKIARKYSSLKGNGRNKIAVIENSYHGSYYGSMSASNYEEEQKEGYGPMLEGFISLPLPFSRSKAGNTLGNNEKMYILQKLKKILEENKNSLSAVILEPVLASGGVISLFKEYIVSISEFCEKNDILFICDEVATGFWRTGEIFRFKKFHLKPDIITLSKGINNGYLPLGAVCICRKIERVFEENKKILFHLSTQNANPICIASALATLKKIGNSCFKDKINRLIEKFQSEISKKLLEVSYISEIRQVGLMIAIDLVKSKETNTPIDERSLINIVNRTYNKGCVIGMSFDYKITSSLLIFPSYIMNETNVEEIIRIVKEAIIEELYEEEKNAETD